MGKNTVIEVKVPKKSEKDSKKVVVKETEILTSKPSKKVSKKPVVVVTKPVDTSSDSSSSESEKEAVIVSKKASPVKKLTKKSKSVSSSSGSSSSSSESESEAPAVVGKPSKSAVVPVTKVTDSSSGYSSSGTSSESEDDVAPVVAKEVKVAVQPSVEASDSSSGSSSESSDSDEEEQEKEVKASTVQSKVSGSSSESSDSADNEEEVVPVKAAKNVASEKKVVAASAASEASGDSDSSSDEESEASASDDGSQSSDSSDSSSGSSSDSESDADMEVQTTVVESGKRKQQDAVTDESAKKPKVVAVADGEFPPSSTLRVANLSWNTNEDMIFQAVSEATKGNIEPTNVRLISDRDTGRARGFGFVDFASIEDAGKVVELFNGYMLDGRDVRASFAMESKVRDASSIPRRAGNDRPPSEPSTTLFVGNCSFNVDESALREAFNEHVEVQSIRMPTDRETGRVKGFAYAEFASIEQAQEAFEKCNGLEVDGRPLRLDFAGQRPAQSGGNGGFSPRGGRGGFGGRGGARGGRGNFDGGRGGSRGGFGGGRGGARGGLNKGKGSIAAFAGKKMTFDE